LTNGFDEQFGLLFDGRWADQLVSRKVEWDRRRPTTELVRELFNVDDAQPERKLPAVPEDLAQAFLIGKVKDSRQTVVQLREEAVARAQLSEQTISEIDYQISRAATSLEGFTNWGVGYNSGVDIRRAHLERELSNLRRERRNLSLKAWQDVSQLRKQFREALAEYKSQLDRLGLL